ncbi:DNA-3-methyladenine glycosylase I [Aliikangiella marina]|uniref:DNA-3-methyladenine glycosylase I n=1 Tax=Aliikangiella marina TaxID=1712262 RepID=A0A545T540_9GAMM|nr:DNA-3-methyladenine glycosylase I [Aliikangiella marina]TQV72288.1 DNA-3-methyladenine glycosylase I [Aliikangiella marina]
MNRCAWVGKEQIYIDYHDQEWGVPVYDSQELFQHLLLDGAQAGLSWITVLKKRDNYRKAFYNFDPIKMAKMTDAELENQLQNPGIIRNRLKVFGFRKNAVAYLKIQAQQSFSEFLWHFVGGKPKVNHWKSLQDVPVNTPESDAMSKALKKAGFTFVGTTICYAFMQAVGMVNDHTVDCFRHNYPD